LFNNLLGETFEEIATYLKNRKIKFDYLPNFLINPMSYPGNKITGLKQISEKFLQDIVSQHYFEIQANGLPVKFVYRTLIRALFQKGMEFTPTSQITMATRGEGDARKAVSTSRIDEPPRLLIKKNKARKGRSKSKSKLISKKEIISLKLSKTGKRGSCAYCSARIRCRANRNTTHINITQTPTHHYFCSKKCKIEWIFALNKIIKQIYHEG